MEIITSYPDRSAGLPGCVSLVDHLQGLTQLQEPSCAAAIWQRSFKPSFLDWLADLDPAHLPRGREIIAPTELADTLLKMCSQSDLPDCPQREAWMADVVQLADTFLEVCPAPYLRLRLDVVTTDACRKFHMDYLDARLVCTYRGFGTQFGLQSPDEQPEEIFNVPTGAPFVMRGRHWAPNISGTLLHRSPPISHTNQTRLVLVLDPVQEAAFLTSKAV